MRPGPTLSGWKNERVLRTEPAFFARAWDRLKLQRFFNAQICVGEPKLKRESVDKTILKFIRKRMPGRIAKKSFEKEEDEREGILRRKFEIVSLPSPSRQVGPGVDPVLEVRKLSSEMAEDSKDNGFRCVCYPTHASICS